MEYSVEESKIDETHLKICSLSLAIRRFPHKLDRKDEFNKWQLMLQSCGARGLIALAVQTCPATLEINMQSSEYWESIYPKTQVYHFVYIHKACYSILPHGHLHDSVHNSQKLLCLWEIVLIDDWCRKPLRRWICAGMWNILSMR